jgi:hypothetical protein
MAIAYYPQIYWPFAVGNTFEPGSMHTARATVRNPSSISLTYDAELYLGKYEGDKVVLSSRSFTLAAGEEKAVDFSVTMPTVQDVYHVYLDVYHEDVLLAKYQAIEDVQIYAVPKIEIIGIVWI